MVVCVSTNMMSMTVVHTKNNKISLWQIAKFFTCRKSDQINRVSLAYLVFWWLATIAIASWSPLKIEINGKFFLCRFPFKCLSNVKQCTHTHKHTNRKVQRNWWNAWNPHNLRNKLFVLLSIILDGFVLSNTCNS